MIFAIIAGLLLVSGIVGRLTGSEGLFAMTNDLSPYITVGIFIAALLAIYLVITKNTKKR